MVELLSPHLFSSTVKLITTDLDREVQRKALEKNKNAKPKKKTGIATQTRAPIKNKVCPNKKIISD